MLPTIPIHVNTDRTNEKLEKLQNPEITFHCKVIHRMELVTVLLLQQHSIPIDSNRMQLTLFDEN